MAESEGIKAASSNQTTERTPGIIWVASWVNKAPLTPDSFCDWYENVHIQEVTALSGVPAAARYEAVPVLPQDAPKPDWFLSSPWLTVYEMNDLAFRKSREFRGLDGQSKPKDEGLLKRVFGNARFETRFAQEVKGHEGEAGAKSKGPPPLLISATLTLPSASAHGPTSTTPDDLTAWYENEHMPLISRCPGYLRTRRFKLHEVSCLHNFERRYGRGHPQYDQPAKDFEDAAKPLEEGKVWVALHEFEDVGGKGFSEELMKKLMEADETEWSKRIIAGLEGTEAGFFRLKRKFAGWEEEPKGKL